MCFNIYAIWKKIEISTRELFKNRGRIAIEDWQLTTKGLSLILKVDERLKDFNSRIELLSVTVDSEPLLGKSVTLEPSEKHTLNTDQVKCSLGEFYTKIVEMRYKMSPETETTTDQFELKGVCWE